MPPKNWLQAVAVTGNAPDVDVVQELLATTVIDPFVFPKLTDTVEEVRVLNAATITDPAGTDQVKVFAVPLVRLTVYTSDPNEQKVDEPDIAPRVSAGGAPPFRSPPQNVPNEYPSLVPPEY